MEMPVLPPSEAAKTLSGTIIARAPKQQSTIRKPVRPRAAVAPGNTTLAIVPGGAITSMARKTPSLFGMPGGRTDRMAQYVAALVYDSVLLIAPFTWAELPVQSAVRLSPFLVRVTNRRIGLPTSMP